MSHVYTQKELTAQYKKLDQVNKRKVSVFMDNLLFVQQAEDEAEKQVLDKKGELAEKRAAQRRDDQGRLHCAFCGRAEGETKKLVSVAGAEIEICNECIGILCDIMEDELGKNWKK